MPASPVVPERYSLYNTYLTLLTQRSVSANLIGNATNVILSRHTTGYRQPLPLSLSTLGRFQWLILTIMFSAVVGYNTKRTGPYGCLQMLPQVFARTGTFITGSRLWLVDPHFPLNFRESADGMCLVNDYPQ